MKVLLAVDVDVSLPGGLETHVRELAATLIARGHEARIAARPAARPQALAGLPLEGAVDPARWDVVHEHGVRVLPALALATNVVKTIHFCTAEKMATYVRIGRLRTLAHPLNWRAVWTERRQCRMPWAHVAVSERLRDECARWYGLDPARAEVIPNGVRFMAPGVARMALREAHGIPANAPVLLSIGRADFVKGFGLLERAWRASGAAARGAWWVTVGGAAPAQSPGRVITGPVPLEQVNDWIHAADLGAFPSHYEGCGLAYLEMLAGGLYALAHDVGLCASVMQDGGSGEIVAPSVEAWRAALERWLAAPRRAGAGLDPRFGWDAIAARIERVYARVAGGET